MSQPRYCPCRRVFESCRRTVDRQFFLLPKTQLKQLYRYAFAHAAAKYNVPLYALTIMATHYHMLGGDPDANYSAFQQCLNSTLARACNAFHGRRETFWGGGGPSDMTIETGEDFLRRWDYVAGNPLEADLVSRLSDYPNLHCDPDEVGREQVIAKPDFYFSPTCGACDGCESGGECASGALPDEVVFNIEVPPMFEHMPLEDYRKLLRQRLGELERRHRQRRKQEGKSVFGKKRLMSLRWTDRASSYEEWFQLKPTFVAGDRELRQKCIDRIRLFRRRHREAYERWQQGGYPRGELPAFPYGTVYMVNVVGCPIDISTAPPHDTVL